MRTSFPPVIVPILTLTLALVRSAAGQSQSPFTYETAASLTSAGDFNNADGRTDVAVVDRATGNLTLGLQRADGGFDWLAPEPSGVPAVTALSVAKFNATASDIVALTAPAANRVVLAGVPAAANQFNFRNLYPLNPGPRTLGAFDPNADGAVDLLVTGDRDNGTSTPFYYEMVTGVAATTSALWQSAFPIETARTFRLVQKTGTAAVLGEIYGGNFYVETPAATGLTTSRALAGVTVNAATLMTYGNFDGGALAQVLLYAPGATTVAAAKVTEPSAGTFAWAPAATLTFPRAVKLLTTIPLAGGARLGVVFMDGTAAIYDFNGTALTLRSSLPGSGYDWLNPLGNDALLSKTAAGWQRWNTQPAGGTLSATLSGGFPALDRPSQVSNVVFLSAEPFANPSAQPLSQARVRDWSTAVSGGTTVWNVSAAVLNGGGLGAPTSTSYVSSGIASYGLPNQYRPNISLRTLEAGSGPNLPDLTINPPAGTYKPLLPNERLKITFNPTLSGYTVRFRLAAGAAWVDYNPADPPSIAAAATVEAYAQNSGGLKSPVRHAAYAFAADPALAAGASADSDGDGLPDQWEKAFNATSPTADDDGDGASNLAEYQAGTDPRDATSVPANAPLVLTATRTTAGGVAVLRLEWALATGDAVLEQSDDMASWLGIVGGIVTVGQNHRYDVPLASPAPPKRFYRLRKP